MASRWILSRLAGWIVRRPVVSACLVLGGLATVLLVAPIWPYRPHCGLYGSASWRALDGTTTAAFRDELARQFSFQKTPHIVIGDRIYVPFLTWLDADLNAEVQVYLTLLGPKGFSYPPFFEEDCELIRGLAIQNAQEAQVD